MAVERSGVFGISAPPKEKTSVPVLPKPKPGLVPGSPRPEKTPPPKKPWLQRLTEDLERLARNRAARIALIASVTVAGGTWGGIEINKHLHDNTPGISRSAETLAPFDLSKLDTEKQTVIIGQNARYTTPEDTRNLINGPEPKMVDEESIKSIEDFPKISIVPSIGQEAGQIDIQRVPVGGTNFPEYIRIVTENKNVSFGSVILEGINVDTGELLIRKGLSGEINGKLHFTEMYVKFRIGNDKYVISDFATNTPNGFVATDFLKDAPMIEGKAGYTDSSGQVILGQSIEDEIKKTQGKKFNVSDSPSLFINTGDEMVINVYSSGDQNLSGSRMIPKPKLQGGYVLIDQPR